MHVAAIYLLLLILKRTCYLEKRNIFATCTLAKTNFIGLWLPEDIRVNVGSVWQFYK